MGFCPSCRNQESLVEVQDTSQDSYRWIKGPTSDPQELISVSVDEASRIQLGLSEVNRVLGGGMVTGSVVLLSGEPGVGKSTILLQIADDLAQRNSKVLYVSGEESISQIKLRCLRIGLEGKNVYLLSETDVDEVIRSLMDMEPAVAVIDSVQTLYAQDISSSPGSVAQVRECTRRLMRWAKGQRRSLFITGHVTKDGSLAGPRVLEHMVDVVLYLDGEDISSYRVLRSAKNRFGSTNEVGLLQMVDSGIQEVEDPSQVFLAERVSGAVGSAIVPIVEGTRPMLVEVQALNSPSVLAAPRRVSNGVEFNRLLMLIAVLSRRVGLNLSNQDIIVNIAGGLRIKEPAADLGIALAVASSIKNKSLSTNIAIVGEVGLSGELRTVSQLERRLSECARIGFSACIVPAAAKQKKLKISGLKLYFATTVGKAIDLALS
jgi:DNA repair protein RadA/Sms